MDGCLVCRVHSTLQTRQSSIQNSKYQVSHKYSCFSWWWAFSCMKHVEKRNKHTKKNFAPSWLFLQDYTGMHSQQNVKFNSYGVWNSLSVHEVMLLDLAVGVFVCGECTHAKYRPHVQWSSSKFLSSSVYLPTHALHKIQFVTIIKTPTPCGWHWHVIWGGYGTYKPCPYWNFMLKFWNILKIDKCNKIILWY
jgi:hypothetical protein